MSEGTVSSVEFKVSGVDGVQAAAESVSELAAKTLEATEALSELRKELPSIAGIDLNLDISSAGKLSEKFTETGQSSREVVQNVQNADTSMRSVAEQAERVSDGFSEAYKLSEQFARSIRGIGDTFPTFTGQSDRVSGLVEQTREVARIVGELRQLGGTDDLQLKEWGELHRIIQGLEPEFDQMNNNMSESQKHINKLGDPSAFTNVEQGFTKMGLELTELRGKLDSVEESAERIADVLPRLKEIQSGSLDLELPISKLRDFGTGLDDMSFKATRLREDLSGISATGDFSGTWSMGASVQESDQVLENMLEVANASNVALTYMDDFGGSVSQSSTSLAGSVSNASRVASEVDRAHVSAVQFATALSGVSTSFTDLHQDAKRLTDAVATMEDTATFASGFFRSEGSSTSGLMDDAKVRDVALGLQKNFQDLQTHVAGATEEMKKLSDVSALVNSEGIEGLAQAADNLQSHLSAIDGIKGSVQSSRTELESLATATSEASGGARDFTDAQERMALANERANDSLSNQRYALYDVADAYRTIATLSGKVTTATLGTSIEMEDQFADVIRTVDLTGDSINDIDRALVEMSTNIPKSFEELSEIAALGGQLGISVDGIEMFTEVVSKLGTTTDLTTESASFMLGRFQTILGTTPEEFDRLASAVLGVGVNSVATESEIADMSIELAAFSRQAGLTEQDIIALSATLASGGIPAERARSAIEDTFTGIDKAIRDNSEELKVWADLAGVSVDEFVSSFGTQDFMGMFARSMEGLSQAGVNSNRVIEDLGIKSSRTSTTLLTLAASSELLYQTMEDSNKAWSDAALINDQFAIKAETVASQLEMLKNEVTGTFKAIGDSLVGTQVFDVFLEVIKSVAANVRRLFEIPIVSQVTMGVIVFTALVGALATVRSTMLLVTAASYALKSAGDAQNVTFRTTIAEAKNVISSVLTLAKTFRSGTAATRESTVASQAHTTAMSAEATAAKGLSGATASATAATSAQAAATRGATAAAQANVVATSAASKAMGALNFLWSGVKSFGPFALLTAGASALSWGLDKLLSKSEEVSDEMTRDFSAIEQAMEADTKAFEETGEAMAVVAVARDQYGNTLVSEITALGDLKDANDLLIDTQYELAGQYTTFTDSLYTLTDAAGLAQGGFNGIGQGAKDATADIDGMIIALDEATIAAMKNAMLTAPDGSDRSREIQQINDWANANDVAALALEGMTGAVFGNADAMKALQDEQFNTQVMIDNLEAIKNAMPDPDSPSESMFLTPEQRENLEAINSQLEENRERLEMVNKALGIVKDAQGDVNQVAADYQMNSNIDEYLAELYGIESVESGLNDLKMTAFDASLAMADAFYNLGQSLYENGTDFSIYSLNGRANINALQDAMSAAVDQAGGDASVLASNMSTIMQALVQNGISAVDSLRLATEAYRNLLGGGAVAGVAASALLSQAQKATPVFNDFGRAINQGYVDAMNKASSAGGRNPGKNADKLADSAKKASEEVRTLSDYVSDLRKVMSRSFELRWGHQQSLDDTADAWQKLRDWAEEAQDSIESAREAVQDANEDIRDAKQEIKELSAELLGLQADESKLEFQLKVAVDYGDTLRAQDIRAKLAENRADQSGVRIKQQDARSDLSQGEKDRTLAMKELAQANRDAQKDLSGTTESAREQRDMVLSLMESYMDQVQAYADTGVSTAELERYSNQLRREFERQLSQLGYNQTEVRRYSETFKDLTTVIQGVPRNITVAVNANPAKQALNEYRSSLKKTDSAIKNTQNASKNLSNSLGSVGGVNLAPTRTGLDNIRAMAEAAKEKVQDLFNVFDSRKGKNTRGGGGSMMSIALNVAMASGGLVPNAPGASGFGFQPQGTDTVPAMLTPGEFVIKRSSVQALGVPFLTALNDLKGNVPATSATYIHNSAPNVQLMELMPHQFNTLVSAVSQNVTRAMVSGADLSVATARSNQRAIKAGAN